MKLKNLFFGAMALLGIFTACDKGSGVPEVKIIGETSLEIAQKGGSATVTFTSSTDWKLNGLDACSSWLSAQPTEGAGSSKQQSVTITVLANQEVNREATITIYSSKLAKQSFVISQKGAKGDGVEEISVKEFLEKKDGATEYKLSGTISDYASSDKYWGFVLTDETGSISCPFISNWEEYKNLIKDGDKVTVKGTYSFYEKKSEDQLKNGVILSYESTPELPAQDITVAALIEKADKVNKYRLTGVISAFNASYCSFDLEDETGKIYVYSVTTASKEKYSSVLKNGYKVTLVGKYTYFEKDSKHEITNAEIESYEAVQAKTEEFSGTVVAVASCAFLVKTADAYKYVFDKDITPVAVKVGDKVTVNAEITSYNGLTEYENYAVNVTGTETVTAPEATTLTGSAFDSFTSTFGYIKFSGKLTISGNYYNVAVADATMVGSLANPVGVDAAMNGKIVDVEGYYLQVIGSSIKYQSILLAKISLSADQSGADEGGQGGGDDANTSLNPDENEVLYHLTKAEITAVNAAETGNTYKTLEIPSESGTWKANMMTSSGTSKLTYLQFRNKGASFVTSPTFKSNVLRVVVVEDKTKQTAQRQIHFVPVVDPATLPNGKGADNKDLVYSSAQWSSEFGKASVLVKDDTPVGVTFNGVTTSFSILAEDGAIYLTDIYVFCAK